MAVPIAILSALFAARLLHRERDRAAEARELYERASQAYAREQFADAAELARHGAARSQGTPLREELLCLRGESLLRAGQADLAVRAFETLLQESPDGPYTPQALFSGAEARMRVGDVAGAQADRQRLREAYPETPWTQRLGASDGQ
jgi:outer membrane protein assembly factor BamD (BamD/ComL family)